MRVRPIELDDFALEILRTPDIERKLEPAPAGLTDLRPGPVLRIEAPARAPGLAIRSSVEAKVPPREGMADPAQRPRIIHALANHELQAVELFALGSLAAALDWTPAQAERAGATAVLKDRAAEIRRRRDAERAKARARAQGDTTGGT